MISRLRLSRPLLSRSSLRQTSTSARNASSTPSATTPPPPPPPSPFIHDSLPRFPTATSLGTLRLLDYLGTVSFAHSGAILAATTGLDMLGAVMVGTTTALGGGTIRDGLIICTRPFWTSEPEYLTLSILVSLATFTLWPRQYDADAAPFVAADALGVGAFCVIGAQNGLRARFNPLICVLCGMATATFGGAVRDVLCKRDVRILHSHSEIYASTAAAGAATYLFVRNLSPHPAARVAAGVGVAMLARGVAYTRGIRLPVWDDATEDAKQVEHR